MGREEWTSGSLIFCEKAARLAYINVLWILFTLGGFVVLGIMPATVAMFSVLRAQMKGKQDTAIYQHFWRVYQSEFIKSNLLGIVLFIPGWIIYMDLFVFEFGQTIEMQIFHACLFILALLFLMALTFIFPLYVQYELSVYKYAGLAFLLAFAVPFRAMLLLILGYGTVFLMAKMPILMIFFLGSTISSLWLMVALPTLEKMEPQKKQLKNKPQPLIK